jgi:hypothetical protein
MNCYRWITDIALDGEQFCDHIDANPNCGTAIMVLTGKPGDRGEESGENEDGLQDEGSVDKGERNDGGEET